jgi:nicotinamidase-related amidase
MSKVEEFLLGKDSLDLAQQKELKGFLQNESNYPRKLVLDFIIKSAMASVSVVPGEGSSELIVLDKEITELNGLGDLANMVISGFPDKVELDNFLIKFRNITSHLDKIRRGFSGRDATKRVCTVDIGGKRIITEQVLLMNSSMFGTKNLLLIIDMQLDFISGSLAVPGGRDAESNLTKWIDINRNRIDSILLSRDDHYPSHIGMTCSWLGKDGNIVEPFITISSSQVKDGTYTPRFMSKEGAISYLEEIEKRGYTHTTWPLHCIRGSRGQQFSEDLLRSLRWWSMSHKGEHYLILDKGEKDDSEMYSIFSYLNGYDPSYTKNCLDNISSGNFDKIFIAGLAKDYCVANSVKDLLSDSRFDGKLVFLDSCMASINTESPSLSIYLDAIKNHSDQMA